MSLSLLHLPSLQKCSSPISPPSLALRVFMSLALEEEGRMPLWSTSIACCLPRQQQQSVSVVERNETSPGVLLSERKVVRFGLPSKGRMAADTLDLLKDCQLSVKQVNPRQYVAEIPQLSNLEVWFQRPKDIVRKLLAGDLDLGIVGFDTFSEYGLGNEDLIIVHNALGYGDCRLSLAIPNHGIFEGINSLRQLSKMPQWTAAKPLRVATGFTHLGPKVYEG
ncbi:hypothetical protein OIU76_018736 [Salix suchowensis]|nr:hypothetical protein OIU76_018736 [Salix suchowensis]